MTGLLCATDYNVCHSGAFALTCISISVIATTSLLCKISAKIAIVTYNYCLIQDKKKLFLHRAEEEQWVFAL